MFSSKSKSKNSTISCSGSDFDSESSSTEENNYKRSSQDTEDDTIKKSIDNAKKKLKLIDRNGELSDIINNSFYFSGGKMFTFKCAQQQ
jgi:hypothetical protein